MQKYAGVSKPFSKPWYFSQIFRVAPKLICFAEIMSVANGTIQLTAQLSHRGVASGRVQRP